MDFSQRSAAPEYMDRADVAGKDLERALEELEMVNRFLGGRRAALRALERVVPAEPEGGLEILDLGTGAGDIPAAMVQWARQRGWRVRVVAVDFNPAVVEWARQRVGNAPGIEVRQEDAFSLPFGEDSFDVVHSGMFLHHFGRQEAVCLLRRMHQLCRRGLIVNDLRRHALAYYGIRWITGLLSRSAMVRRDGPLSVLRGFWPEELEELGRLSGMALEVRRCWAFRLVAIALKGS
jgi:SAM-dependent methyltransferase